MAWRRIAEPDDVAAARRQAEHGVEGGYAVDIAVGHLQIVGTAWMSSFAT